MAAIPELGKSAASARQAPAAPPEPEAPKVIDAEVAFVVYRTPDGRTVFTPDLDALVSPRREPTIHDVVGMCQNSIDDARAMGTGPGIAQAVVQNMMAVQAQAQQRQASPAEAAAMAKVMQGHA
jgi:hypothetical protein